MLTRNDMAVMLPYGTELCAWVRHCYSTYGASVITVAEEVRNGIRAVLSYESDPGHTYLPEALLGIDPPEDGPCAVSDELSDALRRTWLTHWANTGVFLMPAEFREKYPDLKE